MRRGRCVFDGRVNGTEVSICAREYRSHSQFTTAGTAIYLLQHRENFRERKDLTISEGLNKLPSSIYICGASHSYCTFSASTSNPLVIPPYRERGQEVANEALELFCCRREFMINGLQGYPSSCKMPRRFVLTSIFPFEAGLPKWNQLSAQNIGNDP